MNRCGCADEDVQQSQHSPDIVSDDEPIIYFLVDPDGFEEAGVRAISKSKLKNGDLSVCRAWYASPQIVEEMVLAPLKEKNEDRTIDGGLMALCGEIRDIKLGPSDIGAFCVVDDGLEGYVAHAIMRYSTPKDEKIRNHRETARGRLMDLLVKGRGGLAGLNFGLPVQHASEAAQ